jgi:hypothetical protein
LKKNSNETTSKNSFSFPTTLAIEEVTEEIFFAEAEALTRIGRKGGCGSPNSVDVPARQLKK